LNKYINKLLFCPSFTKNFFLLQFFTNEKFYPPRPPQMIFIDFQLAAGGIFSPKYLGKNGGAKIDHRIHKK